MSQVDVDAESMAEQSQTSTQTAVNAQGSVSDATDPSPPETDTGPDTLMTDLAKDVQADQDKANAVPETPDGYAFDFGDTKVDEDALAEWRKTAHGLGLGQKQVNDLTKFYMAHSAKMGEAAQKAQEQSIAATNEAWTKEITSRPDIERERDLVKTALARYGSDALIVQLRQSLMGSSPAMWEFVVNMAKGLAEPESIGKNNASAQQKAPLAQRLWPDMV